MNELTRAVSAELLKLKRSLAVWLAVGAPLAVVLLETVIAIQRPAAVTRGGQNLFFILFAQGAFTMWAVLVLPLYGALMAALVAATDHQEDHWKHLLSLPVRPRSILVAKWVMTIALLVLAFAVLFAGVLVSTEILRWVQPLFQASPRPYGLAASRIVQGIAASGLFLSLQLWVSLRFRSFIPGLGVAIVALLVLVVAVSGLGPRSRFIRTYPWSLPISAVAQPGEPSDGRMPAAAGGLAGGLLVAALGCWSLGRREWR